MWEDTAFEMDFSEARMFARKVFVCNSPDSVQFAFSLKNASFERKSPQMRYALQPLLGDGLFISDGETWRKHRRIVAQIVHVSRMAQFAPVMIETAAERRDHWKRQPSGADRCARRNGPSHVGSDQPHDIRIASLAHEHAREIVDGFSDYQRAIDQIDLVSLFGLPDWFPRWYTPAIRRATKRIHAVLDGIIDNYRRQRKSNDTALIGQLLDARDPDTGKPLSNEEVRNEAAVLFMAGHETTANSLAWTWYLLSQAPDVEARMHREIDEVLGGREPTLADLPRLIYTRAIYDGHCGSTRRCPFCRARRCKRKPIQGHKIPKGSLVLVVPWLLHRHRKLWDRPDHFIPDRFLPGGSAHRRNLPISLSA